jgi:hypothetical protein
MKLSNYKRVNGSSDQLFTMFVSMDGGNNWARSISRSNLDELSADANNLIMRGKITHYVITRGEWEA